MCMLCVQTILNDYADGCMISLGVIALLTLLSAVMTMYVVTRPNYRSKRHVKSSPILIPTPAPPLPVNAADGGGGGGGGGGDNVAAAAAAAGIAAAVAAD